MANFDSQFELLDELFMKPFMNTLFDQYSQTLIDKSRVISMTQIATGHFFAYEVYERRGIKSDIKSVQEECKLSPTQVAVVNPDIPAQIKNGKIIPVKSDRLRSLQLALEPLWKLYNRKIDLTSVFGMDIPSAYQWYKWYEQRTQKMINTHFQNATNTHEELMDEIRACFVRIKLFNNTGGNNHLRRLVNYIHPERPITSNVINFSRLNFSYMDLKYLWIHTDDFTWCDFTGSTFCGDGSTGTCIHLQAEGAIFIDAQFTGELCCKTSNFKHCNFTRANLTGLMHNTSEVSFVGSNFTDATINHKNEPLQGCQLIKFLHNKSIDITDCFYDSPIDIKFDINGPDNDIWDGEVID